MKWSCPVCDLDTHRMFRVRREYWVRACDSCKHRFVEWLPAAEHVTQAFDDAYFTCGGAGYSDYCSEGDLLQERGVWYSRMLAKRLHPITARR